MTAVAAAPSKPQHIAALERANEIRSARAALKCALREQPSRAASLILVADVITDPPEVVHTMAVGDLLGACRRVGRTQVLRLLRRPGVSERRAIGALTTRERTCLVAELRGES